MNLLHRKQVCSQTLLHECFPQVLAQLIAKASEITPKMLYVSNTKTDIFLCTDGRVLTIRDIDLITTQEPFNFCKVISQSAVDVALTMKQIIILHADASVSFIQVDHNESKPTKLDDVRQIVSDDSNNIIVLLNTGKALSGTNIDDLRPIATDTIVQVSLGYSNYGYLLYSSGHIAHIYPGGSSSSYIDNNLNIVTINTAFCINLFRKSYMIIKGAIMESKLPIPAIQSINLHHLSIDKKLYMKTGTQLVPDLGDVISLCGVGLFTVGVILADGRVVRLQTESLERNYVPNFNVKFG